MVTVYGFVSRERKEFLIFLLKRGVGVEGEGGVFSRILEIVSCFKVIKNEFCITPSL